MLKRGLRERILRLRDSQTEEERKAKSQRIQQKLFGMPEFTEARTILFYVSTKSEVMTEPMIREALALGKRAVVPISVPRDRSLRFSEIRDYGELEAGTFGILEPRKKFLRNVSPDELDMVIVPGVAFDRHGNRIGYGMGFYDRFLKGLREGVPVIALAYDLQVVEGIPADPHDIAIHTLVTEKKIIDCRQNACLRHE